VSENGKMKKLLAARDDTIQDLMAMIQSLLKKQGDLVSGLLNTTTASAKASRASSPVSKREADISAVLDSLDNRMQVAKDSNKVLKNELEKKITELEGKRSKLETLLANSVNELGFKLDSPRRQ